MATTQATYLPLVEQDFPSEHAALAQAFQTRASWAWTREAREYEPPNAPSGEQRGFRWTYTSTLPTRTPSSLTIILSVDNYFALHVNGALVHATDPENELWDAFAFTVPVAAGSDKTVVAVRGINAEDTQVATQNPAGFTAAIKVSYQGTTDTETFVTGPDMKWVGESLLPLGWEAPEFNDSNWPNVVVFPSQLASSIWLPERRRGPSKLFVGSSITGGANSSTSAPPSTSTTAILTSITPAIATTQSPTLTQSRSTTTVIVAPSDTIFNNSGGVSLAPAPGMTGILLGFILLFTLWPRSIRHIY
ncbi:hypothetical protein EST38_g9494 [Candolleomyces aberdarensis]|uniref:Uncharacterized protein n=1 Tax=Candolleomyces aberdarensis TaxID=2316362 RepID=A0A4Q2DC37_9AGAR|nr:hypothetical protein EST38_g9494 [Candolleomyces aberdarensis]